MQRKNAGFSLVELSIVLVILGLLTGGILAGQSLIRAAEIRSVSTDSQRYQSSVQTFRDKYMAIPGDMRNAVRFWGAQSGSTADGVDSTCTSLTAAATGTATCNGNGNGQIAPNSVSECYETYRAWQHLANAGLVEGSYSGVGGPDGSCDGVTGVNTPRSRIANAGFYMTHSATWGVFAGAIKQNWVILGRERAAGLNNFAQDPVISPEAAWNLDTKLDDGKPLTGNVRQYPASTFANCASSDATSAEYVLTETGNTCIFVYGLGL